MERERRKRWEIEIRKKRCIITNPFFSIIKEEEPVEKKARTEDEDERRIFNVGSVNPVEDFNYLLSHSVSTGATIETAGMVLLVYIQFI